MSIIKDYIASLPYSSRDIVLFNYPAADLRSQDSNELFYPRAADEFHAIESSLGCIKVFLDINSQPMNTDINDTLVPKKEVVVEEVKQKVKKEGDEEDSQDQQDEDEDDEEKKKVVFNPNEYDWTVSNGIPKELAQVFNKMKRNLLRVFFKISDFSKNLTRKSWKWTPRIWRCSMRSWG